MSCVHHSIEGTEKRSEQICLKTVQNVHNVSLTVYCEQDRLSLVMGGLVRGGKVTHRVTVESEVRLIYFDTWSTWKMPSRQIPTGHGRLDVCKSVYLFKHTPSHTLSTISTITQMSHKHPVFEGQISSKENAEKSHELALRRDTTLSLFQKKSPAAQASSGSTRLPHSNDCSKPVHNYFLKNLYWTRSQLVSGCSLHAMVSISQDYWGYLDITWKSFKISGFWGEFWGIETFYRSKFSPATGVRSIAGVLRPGASGLVYYYTLPLRIPDVIGGQTVVDGWFIEYLL